MIVIKKNSILFMLIIICLFVWQITNGYIFFIIMTVMAYIYILVGKNNILTLIFFMLLLQKSFQRVFTNGLAYQLITYMDELVEIIAILFIIYEIVKRRLKFNKIECRLLLCFAIYICIAAISSYIFKYQNLFISLLDLFMCIKFIVFYLIGKILCSIYKINSMFLYNNLNEPIRIFSAFLFFLSMHELFLSPFFEKYDYRYFTYSLQLFFIHPTYLAIVCITCASILAINMQFDKSNSIYIILLSIITLLTFRTKAIAAVAIMLALYLYFIKLKLKSRLFMLILLSILVTNIGKEQYNIYYRADNYIPIRLKLLKDGIEIANMHFPLGAGFATFGTTIAYDYKSEFYYNLGYMSGYYLGQPVADGFWNGILAQAGWIGVILFSIVIFFMITLALKQLKCNEYNGWGMLILLLYCIISSTAETAFFNPALAIVFIIFGIASDNHLVVNIKKNYQKNNKELHYLFL
jgi:hypothetical protein